MTLEVLGSSSEGNCYILRSTAGEILIIEAGMHFDKVKQALDFNLKNVRGVLVSHSHGDHSKYASAFAKYGVNVYCQSETAKALGLQGHRVYHIEPLMKYHIGPFIIKAFPVQHDVPCVGFLISHAECGNALFLTDSVYSKYIFKDLNNIIVEANYDSEIVSKRMSEDTIVNQVRNRVIESHMSIDTCISLLQANDLTAVNNIVLTHLSNGNSNEGDFKLRVEAATGKTVSVADKGMKINFNKQPF